MTQGTVGVIGAGISGLAVVRELRSRNVDVVAFEAGDEPGGIMRSRTVDDRVLELGPQRLRLTPPIEALVDELGLRSELRYGDDDQPLYVYNDGDLEVVPLSPREALTTDLLSWRGKLRILKEPLTDPARPDETVEGFLTRKFGHEAARWFMGPLYSGLYGTDPDDMLVEYSLGRALETAGIDDQSILLWLMKKLLQGRETPPIVTFDGGLGRMAEALYDDFSDQIHLETPVQRVEPTDTEAERYEIVTDDETVQVDDVVVTTPAGPAATLLEPVDADVAETLDSFNYNPIAMIYLDSSFDRPGIGSLVPWHQDLRISGTTWNASFLGRDRLFTCYVDPGSYPEMEAADDEELGTVAAEEFERMTGASATPISVHRWDPGMPAYDRSFRALDRLDAPEGIHFCTSFVERPGIPGRLRHARQVADRIVKSRSR